MKNSKRRDGENCDETRVHSHHKHKRAVVYDYAYVTVTVDAKGNPVTTESAVTSVASTAETDETSSTSTDVSSTTTIVLDESLTSNEPKTLSLGTGTVTRSTSEETSAETSSSSGSSSGSDNGIYGDLSAFSDPTEEFEDGVLSCDEFLLVKVLLL